MSTSCRNCGFACQQRVLKTFPGPNCLHSKDGEVWLWHLLVNLWTEAQKDFLLFQNCSEFFSEFLNCFRILKFAFLNYTIKIYQNYIWYTFEVKLYRYCKNDIHFIKKRLWKADIAKITIVVKYFQMFDRGLNIPGLEYASSSESSRVLYMPGYFLNMPYYTIYSGIIRHVQKVFRHIQNPWRFRTRVIFGTWYIQNPVNISKSKWMAFVLHFPIVNPCLLECVINYFNVTIN